jgi:hypothetical protein
VELLKYLVVVHSLKGLLANKAKIKLITKINQLGNDAMSYSGTLSYQQGAVPETKKSESTSQGIAVYLFPVIADICRYKQEQGAPWLVKIGNHSAYYPEPVPWNYHESC